MIGNKTGKLGEDIAAYYLKGKGFEIIERNYWKRYGEIDIVAKRGSKLHFIEVKAISVSNNVSRERKRGLNGGVSHENYHPEYNVHVHKLRRLGRVIQSFLLKRTFKDMDWQFDICIVEIDSATKKAKVRLIENELLPE